jgi:hypothetical protein
MTVAYPDTVPSELVWQKILILEKLISTVRLWTDYPQTLVK